MRILYLNYSDVYGSRFNGFDTLDAWEERGHQARMLVWDKSSMDPRVEAFWPHAAARCSVERRMMLDATLSLQAVLANGGKYILRHKLLRWADVVHVQLLHTVLFFSLRQLGPLARHKPTVWTLHDLWPLTGHCVHPEDCGQWLTGCASCPAPQRFRPLRRPAASGLLWRYKKRCYAAAPMEIIVSSGWMQRHAEQSPLLRGKTVHRLPFALKEKSDFYSPPATSLRPLLGIDEKACVIVFRASPASFKRLDFIRQALLRWRPSRPVHLVTLDQCGLHDLAGRYPLTELGWIHNERLMASVCHMSDILLTPSHESFCLMALEAMACATPVIGLQNSAVAELCQAPEAGLAVPDGDIAALVDALEALTAFPERRKAMGRQGQQLAARLSFTTYMTGLEAIYKHCLHNHSTGMTR